MGNIPQQGEQHRISKQREKEQKREFEKLSLGKQDHSCNQELDDPKGTFTPKTPPNAKGGWPESRPQTLLKPPEKLNHTCLLTPSLEAAQKPIL